MEQDLLTDLGALALGSRLKRLAESLMQDGLRVYQRVEAGFEPRWFPVFIYLYHKGPTSITELARGLGVSHPGVNKIAGELIEARLVTPYRDRTDKRKRVLALTSLGKEKQKELEPIWRSIRQALQGLVDEGGGDFIRSLTTIEESIKTKGFYSRFVEQMESKDEKVDIVTYSPLYQEAFRELNEAWINHYFDMEEADRRVLDDPEGYVLSLGGEIVFAVSGSEVLGTCTLSHIDGQTAELAKMAVTEKAKGKRLGYLLGEAVVKLAREKGYSILCLESNRKLTPAVNLYKKLGFVERPFPHPSDYARADIYMELEL